MDFRRFEKPSGSALQAQKRKTAGRAGRGHKAVRVFCHRSSGISRGSFHNHLRGFALFLWALFVTFGTNNAAEVCYHQRRSGGHGSHGAKTRTKRRWKNMRKQSSVMRRIWDFLKNDYMEYVKIVYGWQLH